MAIGVPGVRKPKKATVKKAILEDVYRDNLHGPGTASRRRRQRRLIVRRRARLLGTAATLLIVVPLCVLATRWLAPGVPPSSGPLPTAHLAAASLMLKASVNRAASHDDSWLLRGQKLGDGMAYTASATPHLQGRSPAIQKPPPRPGWFQGYEKLIGNSGFSPAGLFGLDVRTIVIDPGHGGRDPGAIGPDGLEEKTVTLAVARDLKRKLDALKGYRVLLTRHTDRFVALKKRVEFANAHHADLFISIHVNSLPEQNRAVAETFYFGPTTNHKTLQLVKEENQGSDYGIGDFHQMITQIGNTFKTKESRTLASLIQRHLYRNIKRHNDPRMVNAGIHTAPFVVLLGTHMPSVLAEISCISNPAEERRLATASYRDAIAEYLEKGIIAYLNRQAPELEPLKGVNQYAGQKAFHDG